VWSVAVALAIPSATLSGGPLGVARVMLMFRPENTKVQALYETVDYEEQERVMFAKWPDGQEGTPYRSCQARALVRLLFRGQM
jgi:hypothetical protein